jgi:hypothetical protein
MAFDKVKHSKMTGKLICGACPTFVNALLQMKNIEGDGGRDKYVAINPNCGSVKYLEQWIQ